MDYKKFVLSSGREIFAGKNAEQNDALVESSQRRDTLLHTKSPGSPFISIGFNPSYEEIKEAAVYCALKSQDFRDNKGDVAVNVFLKEDCKKDPEMKAGSWSVKKYRDTIKVDKIDILRLEHDLDSEMHDEGNPPFK